jgi:tyrosine decarboxylase / aspartate 1-decarboxylase
VWAVRAATVTASSWLAQQIFTAAARKNLHLALAQLPSSFFPAGSWPDQHQQGTVTCLRSVLMKPEHLSWLQEIWGRLSQVTAEVLAQPAASPIAP